MNIYALKDRMIDYFLAPFAAAKDQDVMAAISQRINNVSDQDPLAQAPHHFELWRLGQVTDQGHLEANREFLADCSTLIRPRRQPTESGATAVPGPAGGLHRAPPGARSAEAASERPIARQMAIAGDLREAVPGRPQGIDSQS